MKKLLHTQRRGLALWLLTLMCLASVNVWGQETKVIDFSNGLPSDWSKTGTVAKQNYAGKSCTQLQTAATIKSPVFTEAFSSVKIHLTRSSNGTTFTFSYQIEGNEPVEIKTYTASDVEKSNFKDYEIEIPEAAQVPNCQFVFSSEKASYYIYSLTFTPKASSTTQCSAPTFSPASGTSFANTLTVTASTATEGGKIVYTTDPEATLDANSTVFPSEGLTIDATTTIRAITVDPSGALENSSEASATYTKINALNGLAELRAKIREDNVTSQKDAKEYIVSLKNAVVTKVSGNNAFIEENETGIQYFKYNNDFKEGQVINGTATVKGFMYNNWAELISIEGDITITDGGAVAPTEVTLEELTNNYDKYESRLVKVTAAEVTSAFSNRNGEISQNGTTLAVRAADESISMT